MAEERKIQMVDVRGQYLKIKAEVDKVIQEVIDSTVFIGGQKVKEFEKNLSRYLRGKHIQSCANGTDALQVALMSLDLRPGDEVIVPAFTYVATAEVIALLGLRPIMVDVDYGTFNTTRELIEPHLTSKTKAIVPVHLFGQNCDMEPILDLARQRDLFVVEDAAQSVGSQYEFQDGREVFSGFMGDLGTTSFYPSKNLGCYGDGGAIFTNDDQIADQLKMIVNHGQKTRYYHECIGVNSRLDSMQAAILNEKLKYLDNYNSCRSNAADYYDDNFSSIPNVETPFRLPQSTHVFHQYTLKIKGGNRNALKQHLADRGIPSMIYYPVPLYNQNAFESMTSGDSLPNTEILCAEVLSLPIHSEMNSDIQDRIIEEVSNFFR